MNEKKIRAGIWTTAKNRTETLPNSDPATMSRFVTCQSRFGKAGSDLGTRHQRELQGNHGA